MERWAYIPGFGTLYQVSDLGRVKSFRRNKPTILKPGRMPSGHLSVALGRGNSRCVHELVLTSFVGAKPQGLEVRHLDGNPSNNKLTNLEWSSRNRNSQDKKWHKGAKSYKLKPNDIKIIKYLINQGRTGVSIAGMFKVSKSTIYAIKNGRFHNDI